MANNISVSITADVADLQVKRAIMSAELKAATKDLNTFAKEAASTGSTDVLREGMLASASAAQAAKTAIAGVNAELAALAAAPAGEHVETGFAGLSVSVREMGVQLRETVGIVGEMREAMMAFGEAMMAAFAIERIVEWAKGMGEAAEKTTHLAETFGMTVAQVQQLGGVATATGIDIDTIVRGMGILDKNMIASAGSSNLAGRALAAVGIAANDSRTQMQLMESVADKFAAMEDGPKKVALAMALFGKSGKDLIPVLNLGAAGLEEINRKSEEYGVVNEAAVAKGMALAESVNESKLAMSGLGNVMTDAFAPMLKSATDGMNELSKSFIDSYREGGAAATFMNALSGICEVVGEAFSAVGEIISALWDVCVEVFKNIADSAGIHFSSTDTAAETTKKVFGDLIDVIVIGKDIIIGALEVIAINFKEFSKAVSAACKIAWDAIHGHWEDVKAEWHNALNDITSDAVSHANKIKDAWEEAKRAISAFADDKNVRANGEGGISKPRGNSDDTDLSKGKKTKKAKADPGDKDNSATTDLEEAKNNAKAKEAIAINSAKTVEELAKLSAKEQMDAVDKAERSGVITKQQATAQKIAIMASDVQAEITAANTIYQAKVAEIKAEESAEAASYDKKMAQLDKTIPAELTKWNNLFNEKQAKQQAADNQLEVLAAQHENQLTLINAKGLADRARLESKDISQRVAMEKAAIDSIANSWGTAMAKMATFQQGFATTIRQMWGGIVQAAQQAISKMVANWIVGLTVKEAVTKAANEKDVVRDAMAAARGAYKALVGIPIIGPVLAPIAAATAFAAVSAFSAEGGVGSVPYDDAPFLLHKNEMVLPANLATPLRAMLTSGGVNDNAASSAGSFGGSGGGDTIHIHAVDARSFERMLRTNRAAVGSAVRDYVRYNGATK